MLRISALAKREGITYGVVYSWIKSHGMPHFVLGGTMYVEEADFDEWKQSRRKVIEHKPQEVIPPANLSTKPWLAKYRQIK